MPFNTSHFDAPRTLGNDILSIGDGNVIVFIKPSDRTLSIQALRPNLYNFSDDFINTSADYISHTVRRGDNQGLNRLLRSPEAEAAVSIAQDAELGVDLNNLRHYWKFVMILNKFGNRRMNSSGTSHTAIITGRCDRGEEPLIERAGRTLYNPNCELVIEGKTVFQTYDLNFRDPNAGKRFSTKTSLGYGYRDIVDQVAGDTLYENTPGGMNFADGLVPSVNSGAVETDPVHEVGGHGVSVFNRRLQLPGQTLKSTFNAIGNTFKDMNRKAISSVSDLESGIPRLSVKDNSVSATALVENIKSEEHKASIWSLEQFGPSINDRVVATALDTEWGINDVKVIYDQNGEWSGSDQLTSSAVNLWETVCEKFIPTTMVEYQLHSLTCEFVVLDGPDGEADVSVGNDTDFTSSIPGMDQESLIQRFVTLKHDLTDGIFRQILSQTGPFVFACRINITSVSALAIRFLDDPEDHHMREFFPSEFAITAPMVAKKDTVRNNQRAYGHFLSRVCSEDLDMSDDEFTGNNDSDYDWDRETVSKYHNQPKASPILDRYGNPMRNDTNNLPTQPTRGEFFGNRW